eukprot:gene7318-8097_t
MTTISDYEGVLYVEVHKVYEEMYCCLSGRRFQAFRKVKTDLPASGINKAETAVIQFEINVQACDCKVVKYSIADLAKVMKVSKFDETPHFFSITVNNSRTYIVAAKTEQERSAWLRLIRDLTQKSKGQQSSDVFMRTGLLPDSNFPKQGVNRFGSPKKELLPSQRMGLKFQKDEKQRGHRASILEAGDYKKVDRSSGNAMESSDENEGVDGAKDIEEAKDRTNNGNHKMNDTDVDDMPPYPSNRTRQVSLSDDFDEDEGDDDDREGNTIICCKRRERICGIKTDTIIRLVKVALAFPFVIVVSALNLSNQYAFLRSITGVRIMNILIYVAPVVYVRYVLSQYDNPDIQRIAIGLYILLYLLPVGLVVFTKVKVSSSTSKIEEGTFCFKPARTVRFTQANFYAMMGFIMEWVQHTLYVLPVGIVTSESATKLSDFPPYLPFKVYFWCAAISTFICGLIIVLNTVLKGKAHYRFQNSYVVWFFLYNVGSPMFVTIVTILFMSLYCDYSDDPPVLVQDPSLVCYSDEHIVMARAALVAMAVYIIQHTLLPSGTFKETMRNNDLEIMFVPVYLQAHYLLKAIFSGVYVYFYTANMTRVIVLTFINVALLALNNFMKPCSVSWVNLLRDCFFIHATLSGIISLNYLGWDESSSLKGMVISTLASTVAFSAVGMYVYHRYTTRSTEYSIASAFLDLEWQVSRGGSVHPRVLEPLISLTLSLEKEDWEIAKKYISQLVWLISYPNMRVQFQSAWGLANLALLDEDARIKIHEAGGTKTLFEWYLEMDFVVQLETLAAIVNLTLSMTVAEDMVDRHKCIPFFLSLVTSNKIKHAQFSAIAIANLARKENFREMLRVQGGIPALVGCIMSHDYQKRRHGCRALANMALSPSKEIEQVFESKGLIDRIIKMALRQEIETQREVIALIRNLSCHARLRPMLLDRGVMKAVEVSKLSIFEEVRQWCEEITLLLQRELTGSVDLRALMRREGTTIGEADIDLLRKMEPLQGRVEWSTWGSKLESIFAPIFATLPSVMASQLTTTCDTPLSIFLPNGLSKAELNRWRDAVSYSVVERPAHGKLSDYNTVADYVTYTPVAGYVGTDFFTYRMQLGSVSTHPVTVAINVVDAATQIAGGVTEEASTKGVSPKRNNRRGNDQSLEVDLEAARQAAKTTVRLGDPSPRKRGIKKEPVHNKDGPMTLDSIYNKSEDKQGLVSNPSRRQMEVSEEPVQAHKTPFMQSLMKKTSMQISDEQG